MPNIRSAVKRVRVIERKTQVNRRRRSRVRTLIKNVHLALDAGDEKKARAAFGTVEPELRRAGRKKLFHQKKVSRIISRLHHHIKALALKEN